MDSEASNSPVSASYKCVMDAFSCRPPAYIPRFDSFWNFPREWEQRLGPVESFSDIAIWVPQEGAFYSRAKEIRREGEWNYFVDAWGRTLRRREGAFFEEVLEAALPADVDPDAVAFDSPADDARYHAFDGVTAEKISKTDSRCVFGKTGGPFLRTCFVRGETQFLMDMAADPPLARALAEKMGDHLIGIAREELRRWDIGGTGIWIYDDMAYNHGPLFSPKNFEEVLLPVYRRMMRAYKEAGASFVILHSDGNIMPLLDMLVDAGIDGLNPLERKAGMDPAVIRKQYPQLILTGGMCNTRTLPHGSLKEIRREAEELIDLGRDGGVVIGTHSINPEEIPLEKYEAYHLVCKEYGRFS